jgi:hypothetical protein
MLRMLNPDYAMLFINVEDGYHLWSESYDYELKSVLTRPADTRGRDWQFDRLVGGHQINSQRQSQLVRQPDGARVSESLYLTQVNELEAYRV